MKFLILIEIILFTLTCAQLPKKQLNNRWFRDDKALLERNLKAEPIKKGGKSVILFIGDGMSITTITAARIYKGQLQGTEGEDAELTWDKFPEAALSKTYTTDHQVADSSSTATAFLCGVKTDSGVVGLSEGAERTNCAKSQNTDVMSILELARKAKLSVGIVSTARITHATPASAYAHCPERDWEASVPEADAAAGCTDIAMQLITSQRDNGGINVVLGGGRRNFIPDTQADVEYPNTKGRRKDGKDLIEEWKNLNLPNSAYVWNLQQFNAVNAKQTDYLFGLFEPSHMQYEHQRNKSATGEPSVAAMTEKAIQILSKNPNGYFLLVESGRIDHGHHDGSAYKALTDTIAMDQAVDKAVSMTRLNETLIVVSADHGHTMSMSGYPVKGNPIFGLTGDKGNYDKPFLTLNYANGPGAWEDGKPRPDLTNVDYNDPKFLQQAIVKLDYETHDGTDVGIYARGPFAYLFNGVVQQSFMFHPMAKALCIDPALAGQQKCSMSNSASTTCHFTILTFLIALMTLLLQ